MREKIIEKEQGAQNNLSTLLCGQSVVKGQSKAVNSGSDTTTRLETRMKLTDLGLL